MSRYLQEEVTEWGLHSVVSFDGTPFVLLQEWQLWSHRTGSSDGGQSLETMPTGKFDLIPLREVIPEDSRKAVLEEVDER